MAERSQRKRDKGWRMPEGAVYVGRPSKWGSPFKVGTYRALARYPSVDHPGKEWEYEGRVSADGMRHDYHHPGGEPLRIPEHPSAPALIDQTSRSCREAHDRRGGRAPARLSMDRRPAHVRRADPVSEGRRPVDLRQRRSRRLHRVADHAGRADPPTPPQIYPSDVAAGGEVTPRDRVAAPPEAPTLGPPPRPVT